MHVLNQTGNREPPHAVSAKAQLKVLTKNSKSKSLTKIPTAVAASDILFRAKNRAIQPSGYSDSDDGESSFYPPNSKGILMKVSG
jgi:hypothetical protein